MKAFFAGAKETGGANWRSRGGTALARVAACGLVLLALALAAWAVQDQPANWKDEGIVYLDHSLNARLHTVPVQAVHIYDGFWSARRKVTTERSLPTLLAAARRAWCGR